MTEAAEDELVFLPLGGSGEIGMNFNAYGFGPPGEYRWIVADCGVLFGREAATPGVDLIVPDIEFLAERREDVLAIIATHAHEDHIGAIPHLWPMLRCPIYATPFTARLITGKLAEVYITEWVKVKKGQPLARLVDGARPSSAAIARIERRSRLISAILYRSSWVIWAYIGSPLLGGEEEPKVSQIAPPSRGGGVAVSI